MRIRNPGELSTMVLVGGGLGLLVGYFITGWWLLFLILGLGYGFGAYVVYEFAVLMYLFENRHLITSPPKLKVAGVVGSFALIFPLIAIVLLFVGVCVVDSYRQTPDNPRP